MQRSWRILIVGVGLTILTLLSFGAGVVAAPAVGQVLGTPVIAAPKVANQFAVFWQVWNLVMQNYVDRSKLNPEEMTYGAIRGMLATLDDPGHTRFLTRADYTDEQNHLEGQFTGIGIVLATRDGAIIVQEVYANSPASAAGIALGDEIVNVDGKPTAGMTSDGAANAMRGPRGTTLSLGVRHAGAAHVRTLTLTRTDIRLTSVRWQMLPGTAIADIAIGAFNQGATGEVKDAVASAKAQGAREFVLDLRGDPGGLLDEAVSMSSLFLPSGTVLIQRDAQGHDQAFKVDATAVDTTDPVVVLIDHGTASAAEIFAAALRDNHRAELVGDRTDGTGTVLSTYRLMDGSALLLGTAEWLTPDGQSIWKQGIAPDVTASLPAGVQPVAPATLSFPSTRDQVLGTPDTVLTRGVQLLQTTASATRG